MHGRGRRLQRPSQQDARRRRDTPGGPRVFRGVPQRHADLPGEGGARPREERPGPPREGGRRRRRLFASGGLARLQPDGGLPAEQRDARGRVQPPADSPRAELAPVPGRQVRDEGSEVPGREHDVRADAPERVRAIRGSRTRTSPRCRPSRPRTCAPQVPNTA